MDVPPPSVGHVTPPVSTAPPALAPSGSRLSKTSGFTGHEVGRQLHTDTNNAFKYNKQNKNICWKNFSKEEFSSHREPNPISWCWGFAHIYWCTCDTAFCCEHVELFYGLVVSTSFHLNLPTRSLWDWDDTKCVTQGRLVDMMDGSLTKVTFDVWEAIQNIGHYLGM